MQASCFAVDSRARLLNSSRTLPPCVRWLRSARHSGASSKAPTLRARTALCAEPAPRVVGGVADVHCQGLHPNNRPRIRHSARASPLNTAPHESVIRKRVIQAGSYAMQNETSFLWRKCKIRLGNKFVVWKLDRPGGDLKHLVTIVEVLRERGVGIRVLAGVEIDTGTANGRFIFAILAALAEFERDFIAERTRTGLGAGE